MLHDWRRDIYRASRLDEFRLYLSGTHYDESEYTAADFVKRMTEKTESRNMAAGTAVHKVIEHAAFSTLPEHVESMGWKIHFDLTATLAMPAFREVALYREHKGIPLFGRCDAMDACTVHDTKTTSAIDPDRYLESYQWRAYLWMSGRENFVYDVLKVRIDDTVNLVTVQDYVPIKVYAYPGMGRDVERLLEEFDACIRSLGIGDKVAA